MQVHNNEITVMRGETFTISKVIKNRDESPYIISSKLTNPYWLIIVSSSRYSQKNRYVFNKWLNLSHVPRFEITKPINITEVGDYSSFDNMPLPGGFEGNPTMGYANKAVFYEQKSDGTKQYKYWVYNNTDENDYDGQWKDYTCTLSTLFQSKITSKWSEQQYLYSIFLVSGNSLHEYLMTVCQRLNIDTLDDVWHMYDQIKAIDDVYLENITDLNKPLITIDTSYTILEPTRLTVKSNAKGVMF